MSEARALSQLHEGARIDHFRVEHLLGKGGMGTVYLAEDLNLGRKVALKVLSPALLETEGYRERFRREGEIAASLRHPGIVRVHSAGYPGRPADVGGLTGADYVLEYDGASYSLTRADTGQAIPLAGTGTAADPFVADGISIEVAGAPAAGDRIMIRTGQDAAGSIRALISDPRSIALAAPTRAQAALGNIGDAVVGAVTVADSADPNLLTNAVIEFTDANTYTINGAGSFAYTDGDPIVINGTSVTITGTPAAGDQFTIEPNYGASGDNSNALLLTNIQSAGVLDGGAISIGESYGQLVASVGGTAHQIKSGLEAQYVVYSNAEDAVLSKSAVNLDEEAANLIRFQQAYQAAAQVVNVTKTLFDSLLAATSR